jgi:hypothetical protein
MSTPAAQKGPIQLTNQDFAEVLEALRGNGVSAEAYERRQATRVSVQTAIFAAPLLNGRPGQVRTLLTRDLSLMGVGLLQATPVGENELFIVKLPKLTKKPVFMLTKPVQCRLLAESIYAIGAQFVSIVNIASQDAERFDRPDSVDRLKAAMLT